MMGLGSEEVRWETDLHVPVVRDRPHHPQLRPWAALVVSVHGLLQNAQVAVGGRASAADSVALCR